RMSLSRLGPLKAARRDSTSPNRSCPSGRNRKSSGKLRTRRTNIRMALEVRERLERQSDVDLRHRTPPTSIHFPTSPLELSASHLRRGADVMPLRPKSFAVLRYLAERPGELVTKRALLDAVWDDLAVSEEVVRVSAREIRVALGDDASAPRFLQTV